MVDLKRPTQGRDGFLMPCEMAQSRATASMRPCRIRIEDKCRFETRESFLPAVRIEIYIAASRVSSRGLRGQRDTFVREHNPLLPRTLLHEQDAEHAAHFGVVRSLIKRLGKHLTSL